MHASIEVNGSDKFECTGKNWKIYCNVGFYFSIVCIFRLF